MLERNHLARKRKSKKGAEEAQDGAAGGQRPRDPGGGRSSESPLLPSAPALASDPPGNASPRGRPRSAVPRRTGLPRGGPCRVGVGTGTGTGRGSMSWTGRRTGAGTAPPAAAPLRARRARPRSAPRPRPAPRLFPARRRPSLAAAPAAPHRHVR